MKKALSQHSTAVYNLQKKSFNESVVDNFFVVTLMLHDKLKAFKIMKLIESIDNNLCCRFDVKNTS